MIWKVIALGDKIRKLKYKVSGYNCLCKITKFNVQTVGEFFKLGKEQKSLLVTQSMQVSNAHC